MNKENVLFGIVGLLLGLIVGFMFANSVNQTNNLPSSPTTGMTMNQGGQMPNGQVPEGHPPMQGASMEEVQAAVDKAKKEPENFDAQLKAADLYNQIGRYEDSITYLTAANKIKPDDYETIVNLGNVNFDGGKFEEAEKWYLNALTKKPDNVNVRTDLGLTFIFRDPPNYDRAIEEFEKSLKTEANHIQTLQNLTVAYTKKGNAAKANETLAKLESIEPTNSAISKLKEEIGKMEKK